MTKLPIGANTTLSPGILFSLDQHISLWIDVREGAVWITKADEPRDIVLGPGDSLLIDDPRSVIVGAINGPATVWADVAWDHALAA